MSRALICNDVIFLLLSESISAIAVLIDALHKEANLMGRLVGSKKLTSAEKGYFTGMAFGAKENAGDLQLEV